MTEDEFKAALSAKQAAYDDYRRLAEEKISRYEDTLERERKQWIRVTDQQQDAIDRLTAQVSDITKEGQERRALLNAEIDDLKDKLDRSQTNWGIVTRAGEDLVKQRDALQAEIDRLGRMLLRATEMADSKQAEIDRLQKVVATLLEDEGESPEVCAAILQKQAEIETGRLCLTEATQNTTILRDEIVRLEAEIPALVLAKQVAEEAFGKQCAATNALLKAAREQQGEIERLTSDLAIKDVLCENRLVEWQRQGRERSAELHREIDRLKAELDEARKLADVAEGSTLAQWIRDTQALFTARVVSLQEVRAQAKAFAFEAGDLRAQLEEAQRLLRVSNSDQRMWKDEVDDLRAQLETARKLITQLLPFPDEMFSTITTAARTFLASIPEPKPCEQCAALKGQLETAREHLYAITTRIERGFAEAVEEASAFLASLPPVAEVGPDIPRVAMGLSGWAFGTSKSQAAPSAPLTGQEEGRSV